jgi:GMP synthase (glutamine-hydrolysing)
MARTVVCVVHRDRGPEKVIDRASQLLAERDHALEFCCPLLGESLPERRADHVGAIVYGGAQSANDPDDYIRRETAWIGSWVASGAPFFGICLGAQLLARAHGAAVGAHPEGLREIGFRPVAAAAQHGGFLDGLEQVYHWHKEGFAVPESGTLLAVGEAFPHQAFRVGRAAYGVQFHPEVTHQQMHRWIETSLADLTQPGAHDAERQLSDAARFRPAMHAWLGAFLESWVG